MILLICVLFPQHYQTVHGRKEFHCQKCGKKFGLRDVCSRHEAVCGTSFSCETCGEKFRTKNAHYKHAVRKKHALPIGSKPKKNTQATSCANNKTISIPKPPTIIVKKVIQLPKLVSKMAQTSMTGLPNCIPQTHSAAVQVDLLHSVLGNLIESCSSASQTNESYLSIHHGNNNHHPITSSGRASTPVGTTLISTDCEIREQEGEESDQLNLELSDFATQTDDHFSHPHLSLSNLATQTDSLSLMPSIRQQHHQPSPHFTYSDLATQTSEEDIGVSRNFVENCYIGPSKSAHFTTSTCISSSSSSATHSQAIQTPPYLTNEFGTQTLCHMFESDFPPIPSPSTASHPPSCSSELHHHSYHHHHHQPELSGEGVVDFGTQTTLQLPLDVSDFGTQTISDRELSDLVHELSSESLQHILPPECMDFGTQTLESEFVGIECLDFGVQTSLNFGLQFETEHQDQSSQTQD